MSEKRTIMVQSLESKSGETNGKAWTRYAIKDANGEIYSTFSADLLNGVESGARVEIEFEQKDRYKNLVSVQPSSNGSGVPETYSQRDPEGNADWDIIGLRKTRCALWTGFLGGHLAAGVYAKATSAEGIEPRDAVLRAAILFVTAAEKDIFERPPGDDGIPF